MLEMYLDGELIDVTTPIPLLLRTQSKDYLKSLITEFEQKHAGLLKKSTGKPCYMLSGVQSCINGFTPLRHPAPSLTPGHAAETTGQPPAATPLQPAEKKTQPVSASPVETIRDKQTKRVA